MKARIPSIPADIVRQRPRVRGHQFSDALARDAADYFSRRYGRPVSENQARRMLADLTDVCQITMRKVKSISH